MNPEPIGRWSWRSRPKRFVVTLVVVALVAFLLGAGGGYLIGEANGASVATSPLAPAAVVTDMTPQADSCSTSGDACPPIKKKHRRWARKFRKGKIAHGSGFKPKRVFTRPRAARRIFVRKINRVLRAEGMSARTSQTRARTIYRNLRMEGNCVSIGDHFARPGATSEVCRWADPDYKPITKRQVQIAGTFILCGAAVGIGVATSTATAGTTAMIAFVGASACGWGLWSKLDPG
jgi:hypothetical protein